MIVKAPSFYKDFKCTASDCSDSCCIGWEIDIDEKTAELYRNTAGDFGKRLNESIEADECTHFKLCENGRCPFLNKNNLCDIILNLGEENLSEICTEHPRFHSWYGSYKESGLGLCCEEALRLLLETELTFEDSETDEEDDDFPFDEEVFKAVYNLRNELFKLFSDESDIFRKLNTMLAMCEAPDAPSLEKIISGALTAEPIDESWTKKINEVSQKRKILSGKIFSTDKNENKLYSKIAVYLIYRHLLNAGVYGNGVSDKAKFVYAFITLLRCFDILYPNREIKNIKLLSKQLEYLE